MLAAVAAEGQAKVWKWLLRHVGTPAGPVWSPRPEDNLRIIHFPLPGLGFPSLFSRVPDGGWRANVLASEQDIPGVKYSDVQFGSRELG